MSKIMRKGFSLLELILAVAIFSLGSFALATMLIDTSINSKQTIERMEALSYLDDGISLVQEVKGCGYFDILALADGSDYSITGDCDTGYELVSDDGSIVYNNDEETIYTRTYGFSDYNGATSTKSFSVTISWDSPRPASISASSLISDYDVFINQDLSEEEGEAVGEESGPVISFDFEGFAAGSCPEGWTCAGDAVVGTFEDGQGCDIATNINGSGYAKAGCDYTTGSFTSEFFSLPTNVDHVDFLKAGGADRGGFYIKQASDDTILCSNVDDQDSDAFYDAQCTSLSGQDGVEVYIYISDEQESGWGKVYVDNIQFKDSSDNLLSI
jgi:prepilin-type N-terminal cleavage/methylation domain-containing protein